MRVLSRWHGHCNIPPIAFDAERESKGNDAGPFFHIWGERIDASPFLLPTRIKETCVAKDLEKMTNPVRRRILRGALATAAASSLPGFVARPLYAAIPRPEVTKATLGFIALTDSSPLIIAREKGFFAKYGMTDVEVTKQASWGTTRDNLVLGSQGNGIDGAHILTPMPYLISGGKVTQNNVPTPMYILARLNLDSQAISVSNEYASLKVGLDAKPLKIALEKKKAAGNSIKAAMTFPGGTHDCWIRYWLAAGGIDPDRDIETIVVPPPQMVANMKVGTMDCFCVGEPWNEQLKNQKIGYTALNTAELWNRHPEKSFAMRADWVDRNPRAAKALLMGLQEAQMWCDQAGNKEELARIVSGRRWFNCPVADILPRLQGRFDYGNGRVVENSPHVMKFWQDNASYPYRSHDLWFLVENLRWGKFAARDDLKGLIANVNREDLWREAATELKVPATQIPASTSRGLEKFFDGKVFDPDKPEAYLASLAIKRSG